MPDGTVFTTQPIVPIISSSTAAHLGAVLQTGLSLGNRPNVFIKVGDSISASANFLTPLSSASYDPSNPATVGSYMGLASTVDYFSRQTVDGAGDNSFDHVGYAAAPGWPSSFLLDPSENPAAIPGSGVVPSLTPLENEIRITHPSIALIMIGTNDITLNVSPTTFQNNLLRIGQIALNDGVIPVFSSLPDHLFGGASGVAMGLEFDQVISNVANALNVPFWNYWASLQGLPNLGIGPDSVHPSVYAGGGGVFTPQGLNFGYNMRNLTAVEVLQELKNTVIDGAVSITPVPLTAADEHYVESLYLSLLGRYASASEVSGWGQVLQQGGTRMDIAAGIWQSPEHDRREVTEDYETILNRQPGPGETQTWVAAFQAGQTEEQVRIQFLSSPEYQSTHAGAAAEIAGFYQDVLNRAPQPQDITAWQGQLRMGVSLTNVATQVARSTEAYQDALDIFYETYLNRSATSQDHASWLRYLQSGQLSLAQIGETILASDEYFALGSTS
jgi:hypothetical protein